MSLYLSLCYDKVKLNICVAQILCCITTETVADHVVTYQLWRQCRTHREQRRPLKSVEDFFADDGITLAGHAPLHKAITGWSFQGWVPPAVIFYSGIVYRKLLENVISLVIQINYRLNICIRSLNSWLYFLAALRIFFLISLVLKMLENMFLLEIILKSCKHVINRKFCGCLSGFFAEVTY